MSLITLDAQGRARVKDLAGGHTAYEASVDENGVITLVPALVISGEELALHNRIKLALERVAWGETVVVNAEFFDSLVPVNNEVPPPHVLADVIESAKGIREGRSGISAEDFLAEFEKDGPK